MTRNRHCFALDLIDDSALIKAYKNYHKKVWPEIIESIKDSGILALDIYLVENRLFMIMEVTESFSFQAKTAADKANLKVQEWERLMWKYQQALPRTQPGEKWRLMERIFQLQ